MKRTALLTFLTLGLSYPLHAQKKDITFQDQASKSPLPKERTLVIKLPILEMPTIMLTARDPFISATVKDPYVTDAPTSKPDQKKASSELITFINNALTQAIKESITILGVSSGEPGENYIFIEGLDPVSENYDVGPRLKRQGETIKVKLSQSGLAALQEATLLAQQQGFNLDMGLDIPLNSVQSIPSPEGTPGLPEPQGETPQILIKIEKIDRRKVDLIYEPTSHAVEIEFKRNLRLREPAGTGSPKGPAAGPQPPAPPKI